MKLAYLFDRFPSFTRTFCLREIQGLQHHGVHPMIFSLQNPNDELVHESIASVHYLPETHEIKNQFFQKENLNKKRKKILRNWGERGDKQRIYEAGHIGQILKQNRISHIHAHFAGTAARTAYWIKKLYGIPFSFTAHANDFFCHSDYPVTLDDLFKTATFIVTVSDFSVSELQKRFPQARKKIHRVYNGIDLQHFPVTQPQNNPPLFLSIGRLIEKKGFEPLIEACAFLKEKGLTFRCEVIGEGPLEQILQQQIKKHHLQNEVQLLGPQSQNFIIDKLQKSYLFVLPCVTEKDGGKDNLPTVIVEAMACGLPIISTHLAGVPEMVTHEKNGLLVEEKNVPQLVAALETLLKNPEQVAQFGKKSRQFTEEKFALTITTQQLKNLFLGYQSWWRRWFS
ncbi:MAG: glycosyltransferase family 4 protein [Verrucomicrobiae bacterium]|nr:glycosyltransferase family 4 protein [Verrucomicrobiae bacterium]